jgi:cob(I)alamin adenosyltransferase
MRVYTGNGDDGVTTGYDGEDYDKDALSIEIVGVLDEFLASTDEAIVSLDDHDKIGILDDIQDLLWQTAGEISLGDQGKNVDDAIQAEDIKDLEDYIDEYNPEISHFVRYRTETGVRLNRARVECRRLERRLTPAMRDEDIRPVIYEYINRLSDLLYVLACSEERRLRPQSD